MTRYTLLLAVIFILSGCSINSTFVYKPAAPVAGGQKLPVTVSVLPFKDGTEDFTKRGSVFDPETLYYNLAKAGIGGQITALTPEFLAKAFADDMAGSGSFQTVRFIFNSSELVDEDFYIEGTLQKATISGSWAMPNDFAIALRAVRRADNRLMWEKVLTKIWKNSPAMYEGCGAMSVQCMVDGHHSDMNRVLQELFAEARVDLMRTLTSSQENHGSEAARSPVTPSGETRKEKIVGVGIRVKIENGGLAVEGVVAGMPAAKAGITAGDIIHSIDGKETRGMDVAKAVGIIRGANGTAVTLGISRAGWDSPRDFTLVREVIGDDTPAPVDTESDDQMIEKILRGK